MFFYTVLFVVCLTVAIAVPMIYHLFRKARIVIYETILPGSSSGSRAHLKTKLRLKKQQKTRMASQAMIEGLRLVREDKFSEVGKAYKVSMKTAAGTLPKTYMAPKEQDTTVGPTARGWYG